ncbi:MAG: hypothetical protein FWB72_07465 [Firmicutes bacterium]|nr:hypothetical protein [Bacillota bacterium]
MDKKELRFILWMGLIVYFALSSLWQILYHIMPTGFMATLAPTNGTVYQQLKVMIFPFIIVSLGLYYFVLSNTEKAVLVNMQGKKTSYFPMEKLTKHRNFLTTKMLAVFVLPLTYITFNSIFLVLGAGSGAGLSFFLFALSSIAAFATSYILISNNVDFSKAFLPVAIIFAVFIFVFVALNFFLIESVFFYTS